MCVWTYVFGFNIGPLFNSYSLPWMTNTAYVNVFFTDQKQCGAHTVTIMTVVTEDDMYPINVVFVTVSRTDTTVYCFH